MECKSETEVLTKRGSRDSHERTTQFTNWKKHPPQITQRSSVRELKTISNTTETSQSSSVARKYCPAPFFFPPVLAIEAPLSLSLSLGEYLEIPAKLKPQLDFLRARLKLRLRYTIPILADDYTNTFAL